MTEAEELREILDRCRRIETRLTTWLLSQGVPLRTDKVLWENGSVDIPSMACSLKDILAAVPSSWERQLGVNIFHVGKRVARVYLPAQAGL